jgi:cytochrome b561
MLRNTKKSYGWVSIVFHWLSACVILTMFGLGLYMVDLSYYDPWYRDSLLIHKGVGVLVAILITLRLVWKATNESVKSLNNVNKSDALLNKLAVLVHSVMYALLFILFISGYLISTEDGRAIDVFGVFNVPSMGQLFEQQSDITGMIHFYTAWILIGLVVIHASAAIYHHWVLKDFTLKRMCLPQKEQ